MLRPSHSAVIVAVLPALSAALAVSAPAWPGNPTGPAQLGERLAALRAEILELEPELRGPASALAKLHLERAERILLGEAHDWDITAQGEAAACETAIGWARVRQLPHPGITGRNLTLAYEANNDRSVQPYYLYVPRGYDPNREWPLVVYLHGWVPETSKLMPWLVSDDVLRMCDERGILFLQPHGRGNTDFQGVGEHDVLCAIEETCRLYSVDRDRVYLAGNSMGGYGAYCIGLHRPDRFAALMAGCAQSDYYTWYGLDRPDVPAFKRSMYELSNPVDWLPNARNLPMLIQHGENDLLVPAEHARMVGAELSRLGYDHQLLLVPAGPHTIYFRSEYYTRMFDFFSPHSRMAAPSRVTWQTYSLDLPGAYWITVERVARYGRPARVDAVRANGTIELLTENVSRLAVDAATVATPAATVTLRANGIEVYRGPVPAEGRVQVALDTAEPGPLAKRPGLCGPIRAVFEQPFLCVYPGRADAAGRALLEDFTSYWWSYAEGLPWVVPEGHGPWPPQWAVADEELSDRDLHSYNLVLFGRPEENAVVARIADRLPIRHIDRGYEIGGTEFTGDRLGLWFCYPNPLSPGRMVLCISGHPWGGGFSQVTRADHRLDLMPDFIVFDDTYDADDTNCFLAAGFFDSDWQLGAFDVREPAIGPARQTTAEG